MPLPLHTHIRNSCILCLFCFFFPFRLSYAYSVVVERADFGQNFLCHNLPKRPKTLSQFLWARIMNALQNKNEICFFYQRIRLNICPARFCCLFALITIVRFALFAARILSVAFFFVCSIFLKPECVCSCERACVSSSHVISVLEIRLRTPQKNLRLLLESFSMAIIKWGLVTFQIRQKFAK